MLCLAACFFLQAFPLAAQETDFIQQLIEVITENLEGTEEFDYTELGEMVDHWQKRPLNINSDDAAILIDWFIISPNAYHALQQHIRRHGPLLSVLELQAIPGFDPETIRLLQKLTTVTGRDVFTQTIPFPDLFTKGQNEIFLRGGRTLENAKGYLSDAPAYEGSADKLYLRLRHRNGNTLSYGLTAEKDPGEALFRKSNRQGFDFYSGHLALMQYRKWIPAIVVGDYSASLGQGLIMHSGFGAGKSSFVTAVKKTGIPLRPFTSVDENNFLRGAGIVIKPSARWQVSAFASRINRDGNLSVDTIYDGPNIVDIERDISSLQTSSLHRTSSEIADEDAVSLTQAGMSVQYRFQRNHISIQGLHSVLSAPLLRRPALYNQFYFQGDRLSNASADYGLWWNGIHIFGETAMSDNGAIATVNGLLAGLSRHVVAAILFRSYDKEYQALSPNAFGESAAANNEKGLYTGLEITPGNRWKIQLYHDIWTHPWLRFNVDAPSSGNEYFGRITYTIKRRLEIYLQFRHKQTQTNSDDETHIAKLAEQRRSNVRLHLNNMLDKSLQLRTRAEWSFFDLENNHQNGFLIYQDVIFKPLASPWSASARVTLFDTDDYQSRIYTFENDLIYYYAIPAFADKGVRYYFNLRYKGFRNLTLEAKYARTRYTDASSIGSGNDEIEGNTKTEWRGQIIYRFND